MKKGIFVFIVSVMAVLNAVAATNSYAPKKLIPSRADMYPYVLNNTKKVASVAKKTPSTSTTRRAVVPRSTSSRSAVNTSQQKTSSATTAQARRVVQRKNTTARSATKASAPMRTRNSNARSAVQTRGISTVRTATTNTNYSSTERISSQRCFADYKACMDDYCEREDAAYNRCYCSAKLAQIDSRYQNKIDDLIQQIIRLKYNTDATDAEIKEYWDKNVGIYTHDNPWVNIDNALNIEWADTQSRVNGQNAFNAGHLYCTQHLRACSYMSSNLRDAYKAEVTRDCETYEKSLQKIQNAAESVIESYHD